MKRLCALVLGVLAAALAAPAFAAPPTVSPPYFNPHAPGAIGDAASGTGAFSTLAVASSTVTNSLQAGSVTSPSTVTAAQVGLYLDGSGMMQIARTGSTTANYACARTDATLAANASICRFTGYGFDAGGNKVAYGQITPSEVSSASGAAEGQLTFSVAVGGNSTNIASTAGEGLRVLRGKLLVSASLPTVTNGTAAAGSSENWGQVTETAGASGFSLTWAKAFANSPFCIVGPAAGGQVSAVAANTTGLTATNPSGVTGGVYTWHCGGW